MSHFTRVFPDAVLKKGLVLTGANMIALDNQTVAMVNGDIGGTWAPSSVIDVTGNLVAASPWSFAGAGAHAGSISNSIVAFGKGTPDDCFQLAPGHTYATRTTPLVFDTGYVTDPSQLNLTNGGILQPIVPGLQMIIPMPSYAAATLTTVVFSFKVGAAHTGVPQELPRFRIFSVDATGNILPLRSGSGVDIDGYVAFPTPASGSAWFAGGATQTLTYTCNQNNVMDPSKYTYFIGIIEEDGANALPVPNLGTEYLFALITVANIALFTGQE